MMSGDEPELRQFAQTWMDATDKRVLARDTNIAPAEDG